MPSLTAADLKDNLHDIQDNIVAPILMRDGRHIFFKFTHGAKARGWLRSMARRVNARADERGTRFTVNIGFTYEGLKALGLSQRSLDSFPEAFRVGMRGRARGGQRTGVPPALDLTQAEEEAEPEPLEEPEYEALDEALRRLVPTAQTTTA